MHKISFSENIDGPRVKHLEGVLRTSFYEAGGYCAVGGIRCDTIGGGDEYTIGADILKKRNEMLTSGQYLFMYYDPDRNWEITITIEKYMVKKGFFGDKTCFRVGFLRVINGAEEHLGFLIGKSFPDLASRILGIIVNAYSDPMLDEQSSLLAMSSM